MRKKGVEEGYECPICGKNGFTKQSIGGHVELCLIRSNDKHIKHTTKPNASKCASVSSEYNNLTSSNELKGTSSALNYSDKSGSNALRPTTAKALPSSSACGPVSQHQNHDIKLGYYHSLQISVSIYI